ncbi:hypothetical protein [Streptomyces sp. AC555_RSS877]|uniref:hypothetical protein n=1 Tax=Streptomyces sp. AC555_RSS877 TaxID=2823688 RepID=UPI001C2612D0|nr:hypothetical protein [Streptomyces sp. AC555_RSS877]
MNLAGPVETAEISDTDLDDVSGGHAVGGFGGLSVETPIADVCADLMAVASTEGLTAGADVHAAAL